MNVSSERWSYDLDFWEGFLVSCKLQALAHTLSPFNNEGGQSSSGPCLPLIYSLNWQNFAGGKCAGLCGSCFLGSWDFLHKL